MREGTPRTRFDAHKQRHIMTRECDCSHFHRDDAMHPSFARENRNSQTEGMTQGISEILYNL